MKKFLSSLGNATANVVTLGGHSRIKNEQNKYDDAFSVYNAIHANCVDYENSNKNYIKEIGEETELACMALRDAESILGKLFDSNTAKVSLNIQSASTSLKRIKTINTVFSDIAKSTAGSTALAAGSWTLVSMIGAASTGTAISTLTGAAATNATLAWFAGGSLATGGAGMAGGGMVLGGIVALPLVIFSSWKAHSNADKITEHTAEVIAESEKSSDRLVELIKINNVIKEQHNNFKASRQEFYNTCDLVTKKLYPFGKISKFFRSVRLFFGGRYFDEDDSELLDLLEKSVNQFIDVFHKEL